MFYGLTRVVKSSFLERYLFQTEQNFKYWKRGKWSLAEEKNMVKIKTLNQEVVLFGL
jgi:hypothetical protein